MTVLAWWRLMSAAAIVNVALWFWSGKILERTSMSGADRAWWRRQRLLCGGFVFGCAFRSFFPRADVQRLVLVDSWLSAVAVGRSVATVAELCFMAQAALHLRRLAERAGVPLAAALSRAVVPAICVAETCSWYAVLTTNYLGNACEESIWTACGFVLLAGTALCWPKCGPKTRRLLLVPFVAAPGYLFFMTTVDVPMYLSRWRADSAAGKAYFTLAGGLRDAATRWTATMDPAAWDGEKAWMALYFSLAVWISLALATPTRDDASLPRA